MIRKFLTISVLFFGFLALGAFAQGEAHGILSGEVISIDVSTVQITVKTKEGKIMLHPDKNTEFKRVSPQKPDLKEAVSASQTDIEAGDRIVAVVIFGDDKKIIKRTLLVVLMTKGDIAKKQESDSNRWLRGRVTAINPDAEELTVTQRATETMPEHPIVIVGNNNTRFRRYAVNSLKYSDATASNFNAIKLGDQIRAAGDKNTDGTRLTAEEIIFGSFQTVAGKIQAISPEKSEVIIKDLLTDKSVTIVVLKNTLLRRFPLEMAQRAAQMQNREKSVKDGTAQKGTREEINSMFESLPVLSLTELKIGDFIAALGSRSDLPEQITAVKVVAGVEPFLATGRVSKSGGNKLPSSISIKIPGLDGTSIQ